MPFNLGPLELLLILAVALMVFGPKRIPEIAHSLGKSINEFRRGTKEISDTVRKELTAGDDTPEITSGPTKTV